ncbi:MAG: Ig-like domain-containing protein [Methanosphaera sp.]|uniref:Ig-like domain-containing protein n=1 Tax=Methanosphaera sp. TaxID=2666342 RepID=UPI0025D7F376|nr:Ig-like domain-containing protein [Methanosphaera sp.]MCI5867641.1 Ig-like domain-containing protein [Methanosphaera sp.]MDD6534109.1 Ig-like domain-containing protein [Methanosphaera sp.]MDY3956082.1 Ig-like domain-containing protein [Methanosphaera sp.]
MNTTIKDGVLYEVLDTQTQKVGNHKITVKLGENSLYNAEEFNINLTIIKRDANISISTNTPTTSGNLIVDVNVTDNEKQIDSGVVSFKINGKTLLDENNNTITVNVTEDGKAHLNYILPSYIGSGEYNITAVYSDKNYERVDVTDNFNVDKSAIGNITADKITTPKGENTTINMTIKDAQGREIYGKTKIAIKIDGATVLNTYIYDGMLNVDLITEKTKVGNHNITVVLGENSRYLKGNILIPLEITG